LRRQKICSYDIIWHLFMVKPPGVAFLNIALHNIFDLF
jgi:hypothetical protein